MVTATATPLTMAATRAVSQVSGLSHCEKEDRLAATVIFHVLWESQSFVTCTWERDTQSLAEEKVAS